MFIFNSSRLFDLNNREQKLLYNNVLLLQGRAAGKFLEKSSALLCYLFVMSTYLFTFQAKIKSKLQERLAYHFKLIHNFETKTHSCPQCCNESTLPKQRQLTAEEL